MGTPDDYCSTHIPKDIMTQLEAGAYQNLCQHLQERSDEVQNIDLMTLSGFCRNCLAKWLVLEARKLSSNLKRDSTENENNQRTIQALDALGYDEAAERVYACTYPEWKKRHAKKASDETMKKFKESTPLHAKHDKAILKTRGEKPSPIQVTAQTDENSNNLPTSNSLLSNVCCQDVDETLPSTTSNSSTPACPPQPKASFPPPPSDGVIINIGILTVSDRAYNNQYETGDLSGPAVKQSVVELSQLLNNSNSSQKQDSIQANITKQEIVPDELNQISKTLKSWCKSCNLILTTGGTGFAPRDVTPEATLQILDRECHGLMSWVSIESAQRGNMGGDGQIMAPLSRGTAGICGNAMIANLPGNPKGVKQVMELVFPLLVHAVKDLE